MNDLQSRMAAAEARIEVLTQLVMTLLSLSGGRASSGGGAHDPQMAAILRKLDGLNAQGVHMAGELDALRQEVAETSGVIDSAVALLDGLAAKLDAAIASGDMTQVQAVTDAIKAKRQPLAEAVARDTR